MIDHHSQNSDTSQTRSNKLPTLEAIVLAMMVSAIIRAEGEQKLKALARFAEKKGLDSQKLLEMARSAQ